MSNSPPHLASFQPPVAGRPSWQSRRTPDCQRRGAVAVEFAVVAPILVLITVGMATVNRTFEAQNLLEVAAREGARFASMDREGMIGEGSSSNQKLAEDVINYLASNGLPRDRISVAIKDYENPTKDFDIDDPANDLRLFEVQVSIDYSAISFTPVSEANDYVMTASVVFRNGRATLSD